MIDHRMNQNPAQVTCSRECDQEAMWGADGTQITTTRMSLARPSSRWLTQRLKIHWVYPWFHSTRLRCLQCASRGDVGPGDMNARLPITLTNVAPLIWRHSASSSSCPGGISSPRTCAAPPGPSSPSSPGDMEDTICTPVMPHARK